jgi:hypothetical protein
MLNVVFALSDSVSTFAGSHHDAVIGVDGTLTECSFVTPFGLAIHPTDGTIFISDRSTIRHISRGGSILSSHS